MRLSHPLLIAFCILYTGKFSAILGQNTTVLPPPDSVYLCRHNAHVLGKWVNGNRTKKTYYSCGWGGNDFRFNTQLCGWGSREGEQLMYGHMQWLIQSGGWSSSCDARDNTRTKVTQRERYEWEPLTCDLIPWNATQFCELLGNRTLLLVGDSTMQQTGAALASRITYDAAPMKGCAPQVAIGRINKFGHDKNQVDAINHIRAVKPDILIVNTGAHFLTHTEFEHDVVRLKALQQEVRTSFPDKNITMIWKTMNPGHVSCSQTSNGPLNTVWNHHHSREDLYQWYLFPHQDTFAKHYVRSELGMKVIDMSPLYYRQDAHSDCLHYCMPGPVDLFSVLLLNMLYTKEI